MNKRNPILKSPKQIAAAYEKGYGPFRQMYKQLVLPRRFPRGDPRNDEREKENFLALRNMRAAIGRRARK
jgi:hypothetical protein